MRRFAAKPNQSSIPQLAVEVDVPLEVLDVDKLLEKSGEILRREIANLMSESSSKKLNPASARDLVNYIKLLSELRTQQKQEVAAMSDDELKKLVES